MSQLRNIFHAAQAPMIGRAFLLPNSSVAQQMIQDCQHKEEWRINENNVRINHRIIAIIPDEELQTVQHNERDSKHLKALSGGKLVEII